MLALLWFLQRKFARSPQRRRRRPEEQIAVLGRHGLGSKAQVVVVETGGVRYVLGVSEHGVNVLDRLPAGADALPTLPEDAPSTTPAPAASQLPQPPSAVSFERALTESASAADAPALRSRVRRRSDPLRGSILSPETWRQTSEALRRPR